MDHNEIYLALRRLIETGELTDVTTARYRGQLLVPKGDDAIDPIDAIAWADDGYSVERSEFNGRMCRRVEELRAKLLEGDEQQREAAAKLPQWFCRIADVTGETSPFAAYQVNENYNAAIIRNLLSGRGKRHVEPMREYEPRFYVKGSKEPIWGYLPPWPFEHNLHGPNPLDWIPNHRVCTGSEWSSDELAEWAYTFTAPKPPAWKPPSNG